MSDVIIVGAGLAGLTAGVYAKKSGFDVTIYESHVIPGGASTSWRRKGYLFEGGIHWMTGSSEASPMNRIWREIGALDDTVSVRVNDIFDIYEENGKQVCLFRDPDRLCRHLVEVAPEDRREIWKLCQDIKKFAKMSMPIEDIKHLKMAEKTPKDLKALPGMLPAVLRLPFYGRQSVGEFAARFKNPLVRQLLVGGVGASYSALALIFTYATLAAGDGGYPEGGSLEVTRRMAACFESLGGVIEYGTPVRQVMVDDRSVSGILLDGGEQVTADAIIVTQDALCAIDELFDPPINEGWAQKMRKKTKPVLNTFFCLGVDADLSDYPERLSFRASKPLKCGDQTLEVLSVNNYSGFDGYAPDGCTALTCILSGDTYDWWRACKEEGTYMQEKEKLAEALIEEIGKRYPEAVGKVAVWDVATPLTYERYLHSYKGSWMTLMEAGDKMEKYPSKSSEITGLYFAGQRIQSPGGMPIAAMTGRLAVQHLCRDRHQMFVN